MKYLFTALTVLISIGICRSQGVAINTDDSDPDASALLDIKSTNKGVLIPRLTSSQRDGITAPATGLMIYNTDRKCIEYYSGIEWTSSIPAGTIRAFGGSSMPDGWLACDGTEVGRTSYGDLFSVISISWGGGDGVNSFNLPDLRGRFLRGQDSGSGIDPDAASRTALYTSGNTGDAVGSYQEDIYGAHTHTTPLDDGGTILPYSGGGGNPSINSPLGADGTSGSSGGNETRPKNANVVFIIKY